MTVRLDNTTLRVRGIKDDNDVRKALQSLYDMFADAGLGQATFEIEGTDVAELHIKHRHDVTVDRAEIQKALSEAGGYTLVD